MSSAAPSTEPSSNTTLAKAQNFIGPWVAGARPFASRLARAIRDAVTGTKPEVQSAIGDTVEVQAVDDEAQHPPEPRPDPSPRTVLILRWILALPVSLIASVLVMAVLTYLVPDGAAGINHLVLPVVLFPVIWAGFVTYVLIADRVWRTTKIMALIIGLSIAVVSIGFI